MKRLVSGKELRNKIFEGVEKIAQSVGTTLGPKGRNVVIANKGKNPFITKDGVTVAQNFEISDDVVQNTAANIVKEVSMNTNKIAGDGTTTATVLTYAILKESRKWLLNDYSPIEIKRALDKVLEKVLQRLSEKAVKIESKKDIEHIATLSSNNDNVIGRLVADAVDKVGLDGAVTVEEGDSNETYLEINEGFVLPSGYKTSQIVSSENGKIKLGECVVLVTDYKISKAKQLQHFISLLNVVKIPGVIVADDITDEALAAIIYAEIHGTFKIIPVKAPFYGEQKRDVLKDLCVNLGATLVSSENSLFLEKDQDLRKQGVLGHCEELEVSKYSTIFVGGNGNQNKIKSTIQDIRELISKSTTPEPEEKFLHDRIIRLTSSVATIRVGAYSKFEAIEKRHRIEDALEAVKSAIETGCLPGGGVSLIKVVESLDTDEFTEYEIYAKTILRNASSYLLKLMCENAGLSYDIIYNDLSLDDNEDFVIGYDIFNNDKCDLIERGIIDPAKVTKTALTNAVSVAGTLMLADFSIIEE